MKCNVYKIPQARPNDVSGLQALVQQGELDPATVVAVLGKTEGNGCVNDFTRGFAVQTLKAYFATQIPETLAAQIIYVMSGGTEGVVTDPALKRRGLGTARFP